MVLCDLGNAVLLAGGKDFVHGVSSTSSPDPLALNSFGHSSALDVTHTRKIRSSATFKESRLRNVVDDWWAFYFTCHRVVDAPEENPDNKFRVMVWDRYHHDQQDPLKLHRVKSECLFGPRCETRRDVHASLERPTAWRTRAALQPAFRDALELVFRILVEAELSKEGFTDASIDAICDVVARVKL